MKVVILVDELPYVVEGAPFATRSDLRFDGAPLVEHFWFGERRPALSGGHPPVRRLPVRSEGGKIEEVPGAQKGVAEKIGSLFHMGGGVFLAAGPEQNNETHADACGFEFENVFRRGFRCSGFPQLSSQLVRARFDPDVGSAVACSGQGLEVGQVPGGQSCRVGKRVEASHAVRLGRGQLRKT
jgi:hypothetical protein